MSRVALLLRQMDEVYDRLRGRLEGLTDDEYFWEPAPGCWTVHRDPAGAWVVDYAEPDPDPPPLTTIGWRLVHLADCKVMYHEWAFGQRRLSFPDLAAPATAAGALARLEEGHGLLRAALAGLDDEGLDGPRWTNWGERWPAWRIVWTMIDRCWSPPCSAAWSSASASAAAGSWPRPCWRPGSWPSTPPVAAPTGDRRPARWSRRRTPGPRPARPPTPAPPPPPCPRSRP